MFSRLIKSIYDVTITIILWIYYIFSFLLIFSPFYLFIYFFSDRREEAFQKLNCRLHRSFFFLVRILVPRVKWHIAAEVSSLRSSIIIANHLSFLDPILFVSLFEKQKTIANIGHFRLPVFGWILKVSGYMPSLTDKLFAEEMINQMQNLSAYLSTGGNLFIFPEGTRSRNGHIGPFDKGAFRIARLCRAPIKVVAIRNTNKLYPPDKMTFNACTEAVIELELAGSLQPDYESDSVSMAGLMAEARSLMERKMN
jgi:1-acyl-sn-glycerol-3-phosphate acyltransferase